MPRGEAFLEHIHSTLRCKLRAFGSFGLRDNLGDERTGGTKGPARRIYSCSSTSLSSSRATNG